MIYIRKDGTIAEYDSAAAMNRYRKSMGKVHCMYCNTEGAATVYLRHCKSAKHLKAKELYLQQNPEPVPQAPYRVKDGVRARKPRPCKPVQIQIKQKRAVPESVYIEYEDERGPLKPPPLG